MELATQSALRSREDRLADDLQVYSSIDAENIPLCLSVAGVSWQINDRHSVFARVRRMDDDYFVTDGMSLFTNSSCGVLSALHVIRTGSDTSCIGLLRMTVTL